MSEIWQYDAMGGFTALQLEDINGEGYDEEMKNAFHLIDIGNYEEICWQRFGFDD